MLKSSPLFKKNANFTGKITQAFLGLRMRNFHGIVLL